MEPTLIPTGPSERRALLVGVQSYQDPGLASRPGTSAALRRLAELLADPVQGDWGVRLLVDDAPRETDRPLLANLLDALEWLAAGPVGGVERLLLISGHIESGWFLPRDGRLARLERTALPITELEERLPRGAGLIVDAGLDPQAFPQAGWIAAAGAPGGEGGASRFLQVVARILTAPAAGADGVSADQLLAQIALTSSAEGPAPWVRGGGQRALSRPAPCEQSCERCGHRIDDRGTVFCPACGAALRATELLDSGRYRILRTLGVGGMGQVFLAEDTRLKSRRAIKVLRLPAGIAPEEAETLRARMIQEARAAQALGDHTHHVVRVFDVGFSTEWGEPFLVMELLDGITFETLLEGGPLAPAVAVAHALTLAETLGVAHEQGVVHRDLKPQNIMLVRRGRAGHRSDRPGPAPSAEDCTFLKVLDFGLVKMEQAEVKTQSGRMMGTLAYMPPEQLRGQRVDPRADVFALGAILFECLSGRRAIDGRTQGEIFNVLLISGVRPLASVAPEVPAALAELVDRCLKLDRALRPADGAELARALRSIQAQLDLSSEPLALAQTAASPSAAPTSRGHLSPLWIGAVGLLLAAGAWALREGAETPTPPAIASRAPDTTGSPLADAARDTIAAALDAADPAERIRPAVLLSTELTGRLSALVAGLAPASPLSPTRPHPTTLRGLGVVWSAPGWGVLFQRGGCGVKMGDRLVTARWRILGYTSGTCRAEACPAALARALHKASTNGESISIHLVVERGTGDDPSWQGEPTRRNAACVVPP